MTTIINFRIVKGPDARARPGLCRFGTPSSREPQPRLPQDPAGVDSNHGVQHESANLGESARTHGVVLILRGFPKSHAKREANSGKDWGIEREAEE